MLNLSAVNAKRLSTSIGVSGTCISTVHHQSFPHCHNRSISIFQTNHPCFHGMSTCMLQFAAAVLSISYMVWYSCIVSSFPPTLSWPKLPQPSHLKSIRKRSFTPQCNGTGTGGMEIYRRSQPQYYVGHHAGPGSHLSGVASSAQQWSDWYISISQLASFVL